MPLRWNISLAQSLLFLPLPGGEWPLNLASLRLGFKSSPKGLFILASEPQPARTEPQGNMKVFRVTDCISSIPASSKCQQEDLSGHSCSRGRRGFRSLIGRGKGYAGVCEGSFLRF